MEEKNLQALEALEAKLLESLASGPATPFTKDDWEELRHLAKTGKRQSKPRNDL
jgi:hypothetical protein